MIISKEGDSLSPTFVSERHWRLPSNPEGCQKVAGGRSEAKPPGWLSQLNSTLKGCQNRSFAAT